MPNTGGGLEVSYKRKVMQKSGIDIRKMYGQIPRPPPQEELTQGMAGYGEVRGRAAGNRVIWCVHITVIKLGNRKMGQGKG